MLGEDSGLGHLLHKCAHCLLRYSSRGGPQSLMCARQVLILWTTAPVPRSANGSQRSRCPILPQRTAPPPPRKSNLSPKQLLKNSSDYLNNERWLSWPFPWSFPFCSVSKENPGSGALGDGNQRMKRKKCVELGKWARTEGWLGCRWGKGTPMSPGQTCGPEGKVCKHR